MPTGDAVTVFHAVSDDRPNEVASVVLAEDGTLTSFTDLIATLGHDPFVPVFDPALVACRGPAVR